SVKILDIHAPVCYTNSMNKTHSKSCVLDAFAYITGIPASSLIEDMGTDGREDGIPTQLIIDSVLRHGFAITPIERVPRKQHPITKEISFVFDMPAGVNRWKNALTTSKGVLYGTNRRSGLPHAAAWDGFTEGMV